MPIARKCLLLLSPNYLQNGVFSLYCDLSQLWNSLVVELWNNNLCCWCFYFIFYFIFFCRWCFYFIFYFIFFCRWCFYFIFFCRWCFYFIFYFIFFCRWCFFDSDFHTIRCTLTDRVCDSKTYVITAIFLKCVRNGLFVTFSAALPIKIPAISVRLCTTCHIGFKFKSGWRNFSSFCVT